MQTRRTFLGTSVLGLAPAVMAASPAAVFAQTGNRERDGVLQQISRENARIYNAMKAVGPRGEHYRAAAANLRVFASLNLDADFRQAAQRAVREHGRTGLATHGFNAQELERELRRLGMDFSPESASLDRVPFVQREAAFNEILAPGFSLSRKLRELAAVLDRTSERFATNSGPTIQRVQDCSGYWNELTVLGLLVGIYCLSGFLVGCAAAMTSLAVLEIALRQAGC